MRTLLLLLLILPVFATAQCSEKNMDGFILYKYQNNRFDKSDYLSFNNYYSKPAGVMQGYEIYYTSKKNKCTKLTMFVVEARNTYVVQFPSKPGKLYVVSLNEDLNEANIVGYDSKTFKMEADQQFYKNVK